ncbi:MAG: DNA adenine methylase [Spirochaetales bacterium]|nr:DNA adenine methylase [Spirochaetales bacterium]
MIDSFSDPYLCSQLIAYIGNKRKLLKFLAGIFSRHERQSGGTVFLDPFCGSGSVARLGRYLDYKVLANDIEYYSYLINLCHITDAITEHGPGLKKPLHDELSYFNSLPLKEGGYMAGNYAPEELHEDNRYPGQRLFYTPRNARFIDTVRDRIDERYPENAYPQELRSLIIAPLLYQAATHANTSGVFKAYHRGFGGNNADALGRIMKDMELLYPVAAKKGGGSVANMDATDFLQGVSGDICYLDPPYNQHQYGSNYHLLNTIARWDKPAVGSALDEQGRLAAKAGIRPDWQTTRSDFCSRPKAAAAMRKLLEAVDATIIVLSYNTDGIIPFEELTDIAAEQGGLELEVQEYTTYRGGRQSLNRISKNIEFQLVINRRRPAVPGTADYEKFLYAYRVHELLLQTYVPDRIEQEFIDHTMLIQTKAAMEKLRTVSYDSFSGSMYRGLWFTQKPDTGQLLSLSSRSLMEIKEKLERACTKDRVEELDVLHQVLSVCNAPGEKRKLFKCILKNLRKLAHKKYVQDFEYQHEKMTALAEDAPWLRKTDHRKIHELGALAKKRIS